MPKLHPLQPPDSFHLHAAEGWLELALASPRTAGRNGPRPYLRES